MLVLAPITFARYTLTVVPSLFTALVYFLTRRPFAWMAGWELALAVLAIVAIALTLLSGIYTYSVYARLPEYRGTGQRGSAGRAPRRPSRHR